MGNVNCNLCGADDYTVVFPKGSVQLHRIVRCNCCSLMYSNPQELIDCESFKDEKRNIDFTHPANQQYFQKQHVQLPDNLKALEVLNSLCPQRGKLLEIGTYLGLFADRIRSTGWDVTGLEPDPFPAAYSRDKYKLNIVEAILPDAKFPDASFDAVVMLHVIEHIPDPAANIRELRRVMKKGGVLVVETPRFDSLMFKILGRRERSLSNCNGHIYFFTVPTLTQLLEKNGFEVVKVALVGRTLTIDRLIYNIAVMSRSAKLHGMLARTASKLGFLEKTIHLNARDMQRIYCRAA